jgi:hypothetical protein
MPPPFEGEFCLRNTAEMVTMSEWKAIQKSSACALHASVVLPQT